MIALPFDPFHTEQIQCAIKLLLAYRCILPVPGSLSSLLHLRNRQRQPLPASMPGTLPDPTMQGSSAVLMPMERQMSMGSNMMGMQGPAHSSSCSSPHVPSMHSEAKLVSQSHTHTHTHTHTCIFSFLPTLYDLICIHFYLLLLLQN
uniref:cAMP responsive element binding protein 5 n=1 Tax=Cyprinus carpio carpio TaxID=630221 RepID=A0A9J8CG61_CYPCA